MFSHCPIQTDVSYCRTSNHTFLGYVDSLGQKEDWLQDCIDPKLVDRPFCLQIFLATNNDVSCEIMASQEAVSKQVTFYIGCPWLPKSGLERLNFPTNTQCMNVRQNKVRLRTFTNLDK